MNSDGSNSSDLRHVRYRGLNALHRERGRLKLQNRVREMIPVQLAILDEVERSGRVPDIADACNYLSTLYHRVRAYVEAELAARKALDIYKAEPVPSDEVLGCYYFMLARILAAQRRFSEAVPMAVTGIDHYSVFHDPPDDFLISLQKEVGLMRKHMEPDR